MLGRVTSTVGPRRSEWTGGAEISRLFSQGSVSSSSNPTRDESGNINGRSGVNTAYLAWSSLRNLGSGDVKVVMEYRTQVYPLTAPLLDGNGNPITNDESGNPLPPPQMAGGEIRTQTRVVSNAAENTNSLTMTWEDTPSDVNGGIDRVTRLTIYKKDVYGNWQPVITEGSLGYSAQVIDIDAPTDPATAIRMQIRAAGSPGETGWVDMPLVNFGDMLRYNASALPAGSYEYRVTQTMTSGISSVTASGTVTLASPPLSLISTPLAFYQMGAASGGLFTWTSPGSSVEQVFRYRPAGSTGAWISQPVADRGNGRDGGWPRVPMITSCSGSIVARACRTRMRPARSQRPGSSFRSGFRQSICRRSLMRPSRQSTRTRATSRAHPPARRARSSSGLTPPCSTPATA
jgi:hypothetical protein